MINISIVKKSDAHIRMKISDIEFVGIPTKIEYHYQTSNMRVEITTIVSNDLAEKIFKEAGKGEINVKTD